MNTQENPFEDKSLYKECEQPEKKTYAVYNSQEFELQIVKVICRYITLIIILILLSIAYSENQATERESIKYLSHVPVSSYLPSIQSYKLTVYTNQP